MTTDSNEKHGDSAAKEVPRGAKVKVTCDYLGADEPLTREFPQSALLHEVKDWAREKFVPVPPSDKAYFIINDKTRHRFTDEEEHRSLLALGFEHKADLRLGEEQKSG